MTYQRNVTTAPLSMQAVEEESLINRVSELMRGIDAYAYDYQKLGKVAGARHSVQNALLAALNTDALKLARALAAIQPNTAPGDGARAQQQKQLADLILGDKFRVSSPLECGRGFGQDIEHRFQISDGSQRFGVVVTLTALTAPPQPTQQETEG